VESSRGDDAELRASPKAWAVRAAERRPSMAYTTVALKEKIEEMYPEIREHGVSVSLRFDIDKDAYVLAFTREKETLTTHLGKKDADECMNGIKCVYLGIQVAQFIRNFEERKVFGRKVA
jgi:hypothetical protein